ncbi:MAG: ROK family transcriptional regulator [Gordonia sp. (in: high G+C Gram-positive bacteria)]|uniref:ROK family transcriptional regulator n=1 Tax=Gordonia sp. (in: high G+C Gram-positive bacteria) TaxID=84139 RepID=UPI0039E3D73C
MIARPGDQAALHRANLARVLEAIAAGEAHQAAISRHTGLSRATVSTLVAELEAAGQVETTRSGRRTLVRLARRPGFVLGVDHGHRHVSVAIADLDREILAHSQTALADHSAADVVLPQVRVLLDDLLALTGVGRNEILAAAIGLPTPIERGRGTVASPSILPGWAGRDIAGFAAQTLDLPVRWVVDNDANFGARAEYRAHSAAGAVVDSLIYIKFGAGLGAGMVLDGRLMSGINGTAGEIGHSVFDDEGPLCRCGNRGCLETLVAAPAVARQVVETHGEISIAEVVALADGGDPGCRRTLADAGRQMGRAVAVLANLVNPDLVVVGGEMEQAADYVLPAIRETLGRECVPVAAASVRVERARHGRLTQLVGAVTAAVDEVSPVSTFRA